MIDIANDLSVTKPARLLCDTQIAGIQKPNELGRLVIEPSVRIRRLGRCFPKLGVLRQNMGLLFFQMPSRISAMTIGATEHDVLFGFVHRLDALMTFHAADAFPVGFGLSLIDPISRR